MPHPHTPLIPSISKITSSYSIFSKAVKIRVTEAYKWHIIGDIIDKAPQYEKVPADYFSKNSKKGANAGEEEHKISDDTKKSTDASSQQEGYLMSENTSNSEIVVGNAKDDTLFKALVIIALLMIIAGLLFI